MPWRGMARTRRGNIAYLEPVHRQVGLLDLFVSFVFLGTFLLRTFQTDARC